MGPTPSRADKSSATPSDRRRQRLRLARKQAVPGKKLDHEPIEQPGLLDLAGVARAIENFHFTFGDARLQAEGGLMGAVLAPAEDDGRAFDARMVIRSVGLGQR